MTVYRFVEFSMRCLDNVLHMSLQDLDLDSGNLLIIAPKELPFQLRLPLELRGFGPVWTPKTHSFFPINIRNEIKTWMLVNIRLKVLPKELVHVVAFVSASCK